MLVTISEITFLGPYFSRLVREYSGEESESLIAKKMLPVSASIGAALRRKESLHVDPKAIVGVKPIVLKRRIRYVFDAHVHVELYHYLSNSDQDRRESLVWLAELHAASYYGAVSSREITGSDILSEPKGKSFVEITEKSVEDKPSPHQHVAVDVPSIQRASESEDVDKTNEKSDSSKSPGNTPLPVSNSNLATSDNLSRNTKTTDRVDVDPHKNDAFDFLTEMAKKDRN